MILLNLFTLGTSGSIFASQPGFDLTIVSCCAPIQLYYDSSQLQVSYVCEVAMHDLFLLVRVYIHAHTHAYIV